MISTKEKNICLTEADPEGESARKCVKFYLRCLSPAWQGQE